MKEPNASDGARKEDTTRRLIQARKEKLKNLKDGVTPQYKKGKSEENSKPKERMRMGTDTWNEVSGSRGTFPTIDEKEVSDMKTHLLKKRSDRAYSFLGLKSKSKEGSTSSEYDKLYNENEKIYDILEESKKFYQRASELRAKNNRSNSETEELKRMYAKHLEYQKYREKLHTNREKMKSIHSMVNHMNGIH